MFSSRGQVLTVFVDAVTDSIYLQWFSDGFQSPNFASLLSGKPVFISNIIIDLVINLISAETLKNINL